MRNRSIVDAIINCIKYLSQQGMAFRGKSNEAASDLTSSISQGNFLELIKLLAKYSPVLQAI